MTTSTHQMALLVRPSAFAVSAAFGAVAALAAAGTFFLEGVLRGTAVMNGSARGTALVMLVVAVPLLVISMALHRTGSGRAVFGWLGACGYLVYNGFLLLLATPFNELFLPYTATLGLGLAAVATVLSQLDVSRFVAGFTPAAPARAIAAYVWVLVALNALAWLRNILPALGDAGSPAFLEGTGLTTNPIYAQDLAIWLPLVAVAATWLWQRKPWGFLVVGALLPMYVLESVGVAIDQWFGHAADPLSPVASGTAVVPFLVLAAVNLAATFVLLRQFRQRPRR